MGATTLSSRAIIGRFYARLEQDAGAGWTGAVGMKFDSDQESETYRWLGQSPAMREWAGGRQAKGFSENSITATNKHYESTVEFTLRELRRDKTGQVLVRIDEQAGRANSHWASLLSQLIIDGEATACYDGQYFFDTDHSEGDSGTQDNDITVDISALPAAVHGAVTAPSIEEMQQAILKAITQIQSFKDDRGEPMNELAKSFLVMVPTSLYPVAVNAVNNASPDLNNVRNLPAGLKIEVVANARLNASWTDKFVVFRTDGSVKPFIMQEEMGVKVAAKAEGSEYEFDNDAHQYGIDAWRTVAYGYWQHACLVTMV
jgi:phage major head subunit gpT-like protein